MVDYISIAVEKNLLSCRSRTEQNQRDVYHNI